MIPPNARVALRLAQVNPCAILLVEFILMLGFEQHAHFLVCRYFLSWHFSHRLSGPSYKRGPPKGYIHAIEQRWHQVESLLGAIMQCTDPRVQNIVQELRQDELAREILGRVDTGPYVSS